MTDKNETHAKAEAFFEDLWQRGDFWQIETSAYERRRLGSLLDMVADRRYDRVLEIGCGAGVLTRQLARLAGRVVAIDISSAAIERARAASAGSSNIDYRVANVMEFDRCADGPWDLVVMTETICYLGWLYPLFDVAWLVHELHEASVPGGRLLMSNTRGGTNDMLLLPWIIDTYHDLVGNVGYREAAEDIFRGEKDGVDIEVRSTLFERVAAPGA